MLYLIAAITGHWGSAIIRTYISYFVLGVIRMRLVKKTTGLFALIIGAASFSVGADVLYTVNAAEIHGVTLFDQRLSESALVTIKPTVAAVNTVGADVMKQCLWSVNVDFSSDSVAFEAGKMICIGPNREVLESTPLGTIKPFGKCADEACVNYLVKGNQAIMMELETPLSFTLQPRNERK